MSPSALEYVSMCTKARAPMTQTSRRPGSVHCDILHGDCMPIAESGTLLPTYAAVNINHPQRNFDNNTLSASMHHTIATRALPTRSDIPMLRVISAGVLDRHLRLKTVALELLADEPRLLCQPSNARRENRLESPHVVRMPGTSSERRAWTPTGKFPSTWCARRRSW